jgi:hypothetical protein
MDAAATTRQSRRREVMVRRTHKYADGGKVVKDWGDGRPKVGPADPATRRKFLDQRLSETEPLRTRGPGQTPAATPAEGVSPNTMRLLKTRGAKLNKAIDDNS